MEERKRGNAQHIQGMLRFPMNLIKGTRSACWAAWRRTLVVNMAAAVLCSYAMSKSEPFFSSATVVRGCRSCFRNISTEFRYSAAWKLGSSSTTNALRSIFGEQRRRRRRIMSTEQLLPEKAKLDRSREENWSLGSVLSSARKRDVNVSGRGGGTRLKGFSQAFRIFFLGGGAQLLLACRPSAVTL